MIYYDLHIHSCLSPCGEIEMTPNNIVNMAKLKELDLISVCDHNSLRQQKVLMNCANKAGLDYVIGVELQTKEEVHILGYFGDEKVIEPFQKWIENHQSNIKNNPYYFGEQIICNELDECSDIVDNLLLDSLDVDINECIETIHSFNGVAILAHAYGKNNGILHQLGFIPRDCKMDGIEVKSLTDISRIIHNSPWIQNELWLCSSDAHQLIDIHEKEYTLTSAEVNQLKRIEI